MNTKMWKSTLRIILVTLAFLTRTEQFKKDLWSLIQILFICKCQLFNTKKILVLFCLILRKYSSFNSFWSTSSIKILTKFPQEPIHLALKRFLMSLRNFPSAYLLFSKHFIAWRLNFILLWFSNNDITDLTILIVHNEEVLWQPSTSTAEL